MTADASMRLHCVDCGKELAWKEDEGVLEVFACGCNVRLTLQYLTEAEREVLNERMRKDKP